MTLAPIVSTITLFSNMFSGMGEQKALQGTEISFGNLKSLPDVEESSIFQFQTILVNGSKFNMFYDSGCGDMIIKKSAAERLVGMGKAIF